MLREGMLHADWCDRTMSMMREKQFEACERRLFAHPGICLFSPEATELDVPLLLECSYEEKEQRLVSLAELRARVMVRLPLEVLYTGVNEMQMLERLLINDGEMLITDWDDIGAAEALVRRLWCGFRAEGEEWKLILPNVISPLTVQASYIFAQAIISEASLSFLGAGIPAPAASWGNILQSSKSILSKAPWAVIFPGLAVVLCVLSLNLLGDGLRDYLDPRTAGRKKK